MERQALRVMVACEYSGTVRDAFIRGGHDAVSCDIIPSESDFGPHIIGDAVEVCTRERFDLLIAHPPCTYFALSGNRWLHGPGAPERIKKRTDALTFIFALIGTTDGPYAVENPLGTLSSLWRKPDQIINPYDFGDTSRKPTGLWLRGLPPLVKTGPLVEPEIVVIGGKPYPKWHADSLNLPHAQRGKARSLFYTGIAEAMVAQWT